MTATPNMEAGHVNAISLAASDIIHSHLGLQARMEKPYISGSDVLSSDISVVMGINGSLEGQIICTMEASTACSIVGSMMGGMTITELDDMGWSAIQEFGNWVAGRAASELEKSNETVDITPPVINEGHSRFRIASKFLTFPLNSSAGSIKLHVAVAPVK
ncbi:chemotaxis protein CheX [Alteribacillus sp. HJP-4]|uniref:chemotaxis protein CheX n=1 Tax=Alteribacillus sp. HJP-4 TaxID=2775394 RepID=UPI0035CCD50C